jgi:hypothetical protein
MRYLKPLWLLTTAVTIIATFQVSGDELLKGTIVDSGKELTFALSGDNREDVVGGTITIDDRKFTITHVSRLGTIGARHDSDTSKEFVIFSSSFSEQTATGQPWVAASQYKGCDQSYNSFLVFYLIKDEKKLKVMKDIPYADLTDNITNSDESEVYCFISRPPA